MSQMIRRTVTLTALTAVLVFAVPAPSHAAHLRGASLQGPALVADLMTRTLSWLEGAFGFSSQRTTTTAKDTMTPMPPTVPTTGTGGSGSMVDPDGRR